MCVSISDKSSVQQTPGFWTDRSVFITGATGFLGKALLVKLLLGKVGRPKRIFLLLREKKNVPVADRLRNLIASDVFSGVDPQSSGETLQELARDLLIAVAGDINKSGLGMSPEDRSRIIASCNVVINCAAEVGFQEPLVDVRGTNTRSTQEMIALASACHTQGSLKAFVHVSTAFVNCNRVGQVEEKIYPAPFGLDEFMTMSDEELLAREQSVIGSFPNTYSFTKNMAEQLLQASLDSHGPLPIVIIRPAIVGCSLKEPFRGWVDAILGTGSVILMGGLGAMQHMIGDAALVHDLVPLDTVVDAIAAAPPCIDGLYREPGSVPVVHVGSSSRRAVTLGMVEDAISTYFSKYPSKLQARPVQTRFDLDVDSLEQEWLWDGWQAMLMKACCCTHKRGRMLAKAVNKQKKLDLLLRYFTTREWIFQAPNLSRLPTLLQERGEPADAYSALNLEAIDWNKYLHQFCYGIRRFVLKEEAAQLMDVNCIKLRALEAPTMQTMSDTSSFANHSHQSVLLTSSRQAAATATTRWRKSLAKLSQCENMQSSIGHAAI